MSNTIRKLDQNALKTGQVLTIVLLLAGYVFNSWLLVAFVAICQLFGGLGLPIAPYRLIYHYLVKPTRLIKPRIEPDNPEPHRFAMLIGAIFNGLATIALLANVAFLGWLLVGIVLVLANVNFWLNFCVGCWMYYRLNRLGIRGFTTSKGA
ncbi:MAG: DUF4395 domain-containing protein [Anaerolineae bacterium]|nr:DUF4395 domain-containing protein [Anaerolineae bacterium]